MPDDTTENEHDVVAESQPEEGHSAEQALQDEEALETAEKAQAGEEIAQDDSLSPKKRAKQLRKLSDEELLALAEQASKADHWLEVARRAQAELDNTVKRLKREYAESARYAVSPLARDLLPILDNLGRALASGAQTEDFKGLYDGVSLTNKMFIESVARHGIEPIVAEGEKFDPAVHEALMTDNQPEVEDDVITQELEKGWKLGERVLRASKVKVNKR